MTTYAEWKAASELTLRDYFAAQALGSIIRTATRDAAEKAGFPLHEWIPKLAYQLADAMLAEREP